MKTQNTLLIVIAFFFLSGFIFLSIKINNLQHQINHLKLSADNAIDDIQERDRIIIDSLNEQLEKMTNSINEQFALIESEDQFQVFYIKVGNSTFPYILDKHTGKTKPAFNQ